MTTFAAVLAGLVLAALTIFQTLLALGAPFGRYAWGGQHRVLPPSLRAGSALSIVVHGLIAAIVLARADLVPSGDVSAGVVGTAAWVVVAYFFLGIAMNLASRSRPERFVMTPVATVLCVLCAVVAVS